MAKKDDNNKESEKGGGRVLSVLIGLAIILIWLAVFACLVKFDVGGIGSNVLYPVLKDVPVVNRILPTVSESKQAADGNYEYTTLKEANAKIKELENQLASNTNTSSANKDYIAELEATVKKLQQYKDNEDEFAKQVKEFNEKVVYTTNAPSISEYQKYYEEIEPENAVKIYRQVLKKLQYSRKAKELAKYYSGMEPASAAATLSEMSSDLDLVCDILENMSESKAALILQNMSTAYAAQITKKISDVK